MEDEIIQEFLTESWDNLTQLDQEIVTLEKDPANRELLASIFRTIHTIKGTCGFLGLSGLGRIAHSTENVLGKMREGVLSVEPRTISSVLEGIDQIKTLLAGLEETGQEPVVVMDELVERLDELASSASVATSTDEVLSTLPVPTGAGGVTVSPTALLAAADAQLAAELPQSPQRVEIGDMQPLAIDTLPPQALPTSPTTPATPNQSAPGLTAAPVTQPPVTAPAAAPPQAQPQPQPQSKGADPAANTTGDDHEKKSVSDLSIRVNVDVLDQLMNLVGELVLTRNQLLQMVRGEDESRYAAPIAHLNRITTDLQEGVMKTRMQPIGNAWSKLPRLVRDLAKITGKSIELEMTGNETELDRTILDAIKDPLTHMVRNSADHGVEKPADRVAAGKSETGHIYLQAYHEGGHVIICVRDDGAGIRADKVLRKAVEQGLVSEADAKTLPESEILKLIFHPGFSTADTISSVSGRGVGMDVVKTAIERIGGTVELSSVHGRGTTVKIKIPLTLAIISALVVRSGPISFAIPQLGVVELVRVSIDERHKIERIHEHEVFRLRDRLLPLLHLHEILGLKPLEGDNRDLNIVVVQVGEEQFGLIVSEIFDTQEIVVKPVGSLLKDIKVYQGTTILGDGRVIMILDVAGIASQFGNQSTNRAQLDRLKNATTNDDDRQETTSLLVVGGSDGSRLAVPLALVARLEEIPAQSIERSGDRWLVQYRGELLPLVTLVGATFHPGDRDVQPVVVFSEGTKALGLMVDQIIDILEEPLSIRMAVKRPGVLGTSIIAGKATDILDTQFYLCQAIPDWFQTETVQHTPRVLVVDDSMFFRQLLKTAVESDGYRVVAVDGAQAALDLVDRGEKFDVILSDIEMPQMDGCQLAETLRQRADCPPLVAVTSLAGDHHQRRMVASGFAQILIKFNAAQLSQTLREICHVSAAGQSR